MTFNRSNLCWLALGLITAGYLLFWALLLGATATYSTPDSWLKVLMSPEIRHATWLSLVTCSLAAGFALLLAVPVGYLMSRREFRGKSWLDAALDIPIILPPLVVGLCLLIFFQTRIGKAIEMVIPFTYQLSGVVLAQFVVAAARRGMVAAFCIAWARSLGEFGPILVFAGATRMKTEVLPTTVWLELSVGNLEAAVAVSLFMVALAVLVLVAVRATGEKV
jgi:molybdate transport system permease protein